MRKVVIAALVLVAVAGVLYAQERVRVRNEMQKRFDENRDGWLDPQEQEALKRSLREHGEREGGPDREIERLKRAIEELLDRAEEAEKAGRFEEALRLVEKAEAMERELTARHEGGRRERDEEPPFPPEIMEKIERAKRDIGKLHDMAREAEERGDHDRARELLEKAERIERKTHELIEQFRRGREGGEKPGHVEGMKGLERIKQEIERLHRAAREAKEQGNHERAEALMREAEALRSKLGKHMEGPPPEKPGFPPEMAEKIERMKREIEHLRNMSVEAKKQGELDRAHELWNEAQKLEAELKEMLGRLHRPPEGPAPEEIERLKRKLEKIMEMAHQAEEAGDKRRAEELWREAEELEKHLREMTGHHRPEHAEMGPEEQLRNIKREREEIMHQMEQLKRHLAELQKMEEELMRKLKGHKK